MTRIAVTFLLCTLITSCLVAQAWEPKQAVLTTKYAKDVKPNNVLPEYPRPQLKRTRWLNLNGLWQFEAGRNAQDTFPKGNLSRTILVPFPVESPLSGIKESHDRLWYKRTFTIPQQWKNERILLHFDAVDYESEVFINGKSLGVHRGGYDPFSFDITLQLRTLGKQELVVRVFDPTDSAGFPRGKQTLSPQNIMYTSVTGIWQTVWLEPVPATSINTVKIIPDIDKSVLRLLVNTAGDSLGYSVKVKIIDGSKVIQTKMGKANTELIIPVPNEKLWSPDNPFLYDLKISLVKGKAVIDSVSSYFGMRKVSIENEDGYKKLFLNNKFLFETGPLDQGFWPESGYTAPTDKALKSDLEMIKAFGFNMVRKHIKVEPYRWYYWADKLGVMVWQDMPSINSYTRRKQKIDTAAFENELTRLVETHFNSPSIVMWVVFNESQGQHNTVQLVDKLRALDSTRFINQASGAEHFGVGDVLDIHSYPAPAAPASDTQSLACGEYGGIGFKVKGHLWQDGFGYVMAQNENEYLHLYDSFANDLITYKTNLGLSAAVYTQLTDVEIEVNGLLTYDRIIKADVGKIRETNSNVINNKIYAKALLPSSARDARLWKYTFNKPDSTTWFTTGFNDSEWKSGEAGFGAPATFGGRVRTKWDTTDIWIRQAFKLSDISRINKQNLVLFIQNDDNCEVYINSEKAAVIGRHNDGYTKIVISEAAKATLRSNSNNVIAIHCKQISGGQFIDAGIYETNLTQ